MLRVQCLIVLLFWSGVAQGQVKIEYIAHASFIVESSAGTRVAIDPYSGKHSLGYDYPRGLTADAVLVTHPHFDHDATYYFGAQTPVFTEEGKYVTRSIKMTGMKAEHVGASRFRASGAMPYNTIWLLEVDGMKVLHLGDNGLLNDDLLNIIGSVDILMIQVFEEHYIYDDREFDRITEALNPSVIIPMHYQLTAISNIPSWTGDVDPWLDRKNGLRHDSNRLMVKKSELTGDRKIVKLPHSPQVRPWSPALRNSWDEFLTIRRQLTGPNKDLESLRERSSKLTAQFKNVLIFHTLSARVLDSLQQYDQVAQVLLEGLSNCGLDDWEQQVIAHGRLGKYYADRGKEELAAEQYRWVLGQKRTYQQGILEEAIAFFDNRK